MKKYETLLAEAREMALSGDDWVERGGEVIYSDQLAGELHDALKDALEGLAEAWYEGADAAYAYDPYNPPKNPYEEVSE